MKLLSPLGLAMLAMLAFGVVGVGAAQAAPEWHVNGKTFKEAGITEKAYVLGGGTITTEVPGLGVTINCPITSKSSGKLVGKSSGSANIQTSECSVVGSTSCKVEPMSLSFALGLTTGPSGEVIETFSPLGAPFSQIKFKGASCSYAGVVWDSFAAEGNLGAKVGPESSIVSLTGVSSSKILAFVGNEVAYISLSGSAQQALVTGEKFGAW